MVGTTLHHYRIIEALGSGGMGEVYAAEDTRLKRRVALKVLPRIVATDAERRDRFEREAQAIAALNHPNIVTVHSIELAGDVPFLTMELVEGKTLADLIPRGGMPPAKLLTIAIALADAVAAAHQRGIVHRDLKPANVMVTGDGRVKVLDFGLAKLRDDAAAVAGLSVMPTKPITGEGRIIGTVAYMAPEQADGKPVDARSDIFSLGVLLFEMATGEKPFKGDTSLSILSSIIKDTPASVTDLNRAMPLALGRIVKRCLAKDPSRRYQSALDLRNDLEDLKQEIDSGTIASAVTAPIGVVRWRGFPWPAAITVAIVMMAFVAYATWSRVRMLPAAATSTAPSAPSARGVAVAVFENRTANPSLDALGSMAADRLIQGIRETGVTEVAPSAMTASAASAAPSGVGTMITGTYYLQGDTLEFVARVLEVPSGRLVAALEPVSGARGAPQMVLEPLRQRVMTAVAMRLQSFADLSLDLNLTSHVPPYDAYREFITGLELFGREYSEASRHFERSLEIDPQFMWVKEYVAVTYYNQQKYEQAAAVLAPLVERRDRLSVFERLHVDWFSAVLQGRQMEALKYILEAEKIAPTNYLVNYLVARSQAIVNRPHAVLAEFAKLPYPEQMARFGSGSWRFRAAATARHMIGDFEGELREVRETERIEPELLEHRGAEARALIGLGKTGDALRVVDGFLALPGSAGATMLTVAQELRAHGHGQASLDLASRTVAWYRNRPPETAKAEVSRADLGRALFTAERWDEARKIFGALAHDFPNNLEYMGFLGAIAARAGDRADADKWSASLQQLSQSYLFGRHTMWQARIAAQLHEEAAAVDLLRDAFAQGAPFRIEIHRDIDLEPLRENAAFRELMRPKE
jgi:tetratricopeptide (TPR) repeat protein